MSEEERISEEIVSLTDTYGGLDGDAYWLALYRIKDLARQLAKLTLQKKGS